ncbi:MAG: YIP1 family protein [bacterium]
MDPVAQSAPESTPGASGPLGISAAFRVLFAPTAAFRAVAADGLWVGPVLLCFLFALIGGWIALPVSLDFGREMAIASMERFGAPEEAIDEALAKMPDPDDRSFKVVAQNVGGTVFTPIFGILFGAIVIHLGSRFLGSRQGFRFSLAAAATAMVVAMLGSLVKSIVMAMSGTVEVSLGPAALIPDLDFYSKGAALLEILDPFAIWFLVVSAIGVSVVHRLSRGGGFGIAFVWWILGMIPVIGMRLFLSWTMSGA